MDASCTGTERSHPWPVAQAAGPRREGEEPKPAMHEAEKSDLAIVAVKPANNSGQPDAEWVEPRAGAEGNAAQQRMRRAQDRASVSQALDRIRKAAKERKKERFTALLHHVDVPMLRTAFYALRRDAAPGADGLTWQDYESDLDRRVEDLHDRVHRGGSIGERTGRNHRGGGSLRSLMGDSARWRLPRWRTRLSSVRSLWC
jgi:hypothetical protein